MHKVIAIVGPTGVGKTKLSIELAKKINGEVINADSTQVYRGLDVATAKVTKEEMKGVKHHLLDIKEINENYTVYDYQKDARLIIDDLLKQHKTPILVGGTGLYIKAVLYDYQFEEEKPKNTYPKLKDLEVYNLLLEVDPKTTIHPNNRKRIIRALNYFNEHQVPFSDKIKNDKLLYEPIIIGLTTDRDKLYEIINNRADKMINNGLLDEARSLYSHNAYSKAIITPIGYKELFPYFKGKISLKEATEVIKQSSRKYAKRQYTWFNNQMNVHWFEVDFDNFDNTVNEVLDYIEKES